jgi:hypothetical protein
MQELMKQRLRRSEAVTEADIREAVEDHRLVQQGLHDLDQQLVQEMDNEASSYLSKRRVPVVGYIPLPPKKLAGTYRWLFGNINGLSTNRTRNFKSETLRSLLTEYEPDGLGFVEIGIDVCHLKPSETIATILQLDGTTRTAISSRWLCYHWFGRDLSVC